MRLVILRSLAMALAIAAICVVRNRFVSAQSPSSLIGERPALEKHLNQTDIENGAIDGSTFATSIKWFQAAHHS